jgi:hypothetical protein
VASCRECGVEPSGSCSMVLVCACAPDFAVSDKSAVSNCTYLLKINSVYYFINNCDIFRFPSALESNKYVTLKSLPTS